MMYFFIRPSSFDNNKASKSFKKKFKELDKDLIICMLYGLGVILFIIYLYCQPKSMTLLTKKILLEILCIDSDQSFMDSCLAINEIIYISKRWDKMKEIKIETKDNMLKEYFEEYFETDWIKTLDYHNRKISKERLNLLRRKKKVILKNKDLVLKTAQYSIFKNKIQNIDYYSLKDYFIDIGEMVYSALMKDKILEIPITQEENTLIKNKLYCNNKPGKPNIDITEKNKKIYLQYMKARVNSII